MASRRGIWFGCMAAAAAGWLLSFPLLSIRWDLNGLSEAQVVERGGDALFSPNHLLYQPAGWLAYRLLQQAGYAGRSAPVLQWLTALCAGLGVGFFFAAAFRLTRNPAAAATAAALLAVSWSYWSLSTDVYYITPAAMMVSLALVLLFGDVQTRGTMIALGGVCAAAVLLWQANIFLWPAVLGAILWKHRANFETAWAMAGLFLATAALVTVVTYVGIGSVVLRHYGLTDLVQWAFGHGGDESGRVFLWGHWGLDRFGYALRSGLAAFIPIWEGVGLSDTLHGSVRLDKIAGLFSVFAFAGLIGGSAIICFKRHASHPELLRIVGGLVLAYALYLPFIIWWDPYEPKWYVVPNLFLLMAFAKIWSTHSRPQVALVGIAFIAVIAFANFSLTIWPRHSTPSPGMQVAECFAQKATASDLFVITDWDWFGYAGYWYGYRGESLDLLGKGQESGSARLRIAGRMNAVHRRGGHIYVTDWDSYSTAQRRFAEQLTGLDDQALPSWKQRAAFECAPVRFVELEPSW